MASSSMSRRFQPPASQRSSSTSMASSRSAIGSRASDPLEPLRAMADRVGKEVERFAEEVDNWQAHGKEDSVVYKSTVKLVDNFRGLAESRVRDLKKKSSTDDQDELDKNVRRRIKGLANDDGQRLFAESARSIVPSIEPSAASGVRELRHWQAELATWELLRVVIEQHHPAPGVDVAARKSARLANAGGKSRYSPKNEVWDRFILEDDAAREKMIIIKWLQSTARNTENDIKSLLGQWGEVSGKDTNTWTSGWLDTKAAIKQAKRVQGVDKPLDKDHTIHGKGTVDPLVTRLDPDAPCRQVRALHKTDDIYENALWMVCYEMLRQGEPWEKISEWCKDRNEAWRSVSLGAAFATHPDGGPNLAGNDLGYLFRRMCVYASRGAKMPYEGAVYALLSGETKRIVESEVIKSWDEHLYGYYNGLLLSRFDSYIRQNPQSQPWVSDEAVLDFVFHDASRFDVDDWETSSQQIIEKLMKDGAVTSTEAKTPIKLIQGALISQKTEDLLYKVGVALADILQDDDRPLNLIIDPDTEDLHNPTSKKAIGDRSVVADPHHQALARDPHALRLLAHICMIYREGIQTIKWEEDAEAYAMQNVVVAYIEVLRLKKKYQTIPIYANHLGIWRATHCLSRILPDIKNSEEQKIFADLMSSEAYGFDPVLVIRENFMFHLMALGYLERNPVSVPEPVSKFTIVGKWTEGKDAYLWPGLRIQNDIDGFDITSKEEDLLQSLQWFRHVVADCEQTFQCLEMALTVLLLNGRLGAAEKLVDEMGVETISMSRTVARFGYAFDFTQSDAEIQTQDQVAEAMRNSSSENGSVRPSKIPNDEVHAKQVFWLRETSRGYFELSQLVRLIANFREWRAEEDSLIRQNDTAQPVSTKRVKELFSIIEATFTSIIDPLERMVENNWDIYRTYYPDIVLAYLSVLLSGSFFIHRDSATKAMDLATVVADKERGWLQKTFLETGRMSELVEAFAIVSRAMLKLGEHDLSKSKPAKKRGNRGETLRIWDVNVRN